MSEMMGPGMAAATFSVASEVVTTTPTAVAEIGASGADATSTMIDITSSIHAYSGAIKEAPSLIDVNSFNDTPEPFGMFSVSKSGFSSQSTSSIFDLSAPTFSIAEMTTPNQPIEIPGVFHEAFKDIPAPIEIPSAYYEAFQDDPLQSLAEGQKTDMSVESTIFDDLVLADSIPTPAAILESYIAESAKPSEMPEEQDQTAAQVLETIKTDNPTAYVEIVKDLEIAAGISDLLTDIGTSSEKTDEITQNALNTALDRKGLIQIITDSQETEETITEQEELTTNSLTEVEELTITDSLTDAEELTREDETANMKDTSGEQIIFVKDIPANSAREKNGANALTKVSSITSNDGIIHGSDLVAEMGYQPSYDQRSDLVITHNLGQDRSYKEIMDILAIETFKSEEEARQRIMQLIHDITAVKEAPRGEEAEEKAVRRIIDIDQYKREKMAQKIAA